MQIVSSHHQFLLPNAVTTLIAAVQRMPDPPRRRNRGRCCHDYRLLSTYSVPGTVSRPLYALSHFPSQQLLGFDIINILILTERLSNLLESTQLLAGPGLSLVCRTEIQCPAALCFPVRCLLSQVQGYGAWG